MAFRLLQFDRELLNQFSMTLNGGEVGPPVKNWAGLTSTSTTATRFPVPFQFPIVIKSDNKGVEYEEKNMFNIEPLAIFKGSISVQRPE